MIALGSDHAGFEYKEHIAAVLRERSIPFRDIGTHSADSTDYPDWAVAVARAVSRGECDRGILVCGTGIGVSIVANKIIGIRAAVCESTLSAKLSRQHNDANILCLGQRVISWETAAEILDLFLSTPFESGGRHELRVRKIHDLTQR